MHAWNKPSVTVKSFGLEVLPLNLDSVRRIQRTLGGYWQLTTHVSHVSPAELEAPLYYFPAFNVVIGLPA